MGYISGKQLLYLDPPETPRNRQLYLLPKIHKTRDKWPQKDKMPPGRPIVSDCGSESYRVAEYIDEFLGPLATAHNSYVKDTTDFIEKVTKLSIPENAMLFSMDVESLYTNIDNTSGLEAVKQAFRRSTNCNRPDAEILELLGISLNNNAFQFQGKFYKQIWGTAMGQKYAPNYANIFMAEWERQALDKCPKKPLLYLRYLDDIFGIWTHGEAEFNTFWKILNTHQNCIKVTAETSYEEINFLDTTIFKGNRFSQIRKLDSKVYFKTTDTHQLLHKKSFHPKHTFTGILKSQILRFHRICNNVADFDKATKILFESLAKRGYSRRFLRSVKIQTIRNISNRNRREGANKCEGNKCQTCKHFITFKAPKPDGRIREIKTNNCSTENIIYLISCTKCDREYVGETMNTLRSRMNQHKSDIRRAAQTPVADHFNARNHDLADMRVTILESGPFSTNDDLETTYRRNKESLWIQTLKTTEPRGLNIREDSYNIIPFVIPFSKYAGEVIMKARESYVKLQLKFPKVFTPRFIAAYSRNKNIKEMVVSTTLRGEQ